MNDEDLLTRQAEMVLAAGERRDPRPSDEQPRVWVYRNKVKGLNWYRSVRDKLDDPQCECVAQPSASFPCPRSRPLRERTI